MKKSAVCPISCLNPLPCKFLAASLNLLPKASKTVPFSSCFERSVDKMSFKIESVRVQFSTCAIFKRISISK